MRGHRLRSIAMQSSPGRKRHSHSHPATKPQTLSEQSADSGIGGALVTRDSTDSIKTQASIDSQTEDPDKGVSTSSDVGSKYLVVDEDYFGSSSVFPLSPAMKSRTSDTALSVSPIDETTEEHAAAQVSTEDSTHAASSDCGLLSLSTVETEEGGKTDEVFSDGKVKLPAEGLAIINTVNMQVPCSCTFTNMVCVC